MLLLTLIVSVFFTMFFYCQAMMGGLARKRWAFAGMLFGPLVWPMFTMKKRMQLNRQIGCHCLILKA